MRHLAGRKAGSIGNPHIAHSLGVKSPGHARHAASCRQTLGKRRTHYLLDSETLWFGNAWSRNNASSANKESEHPRKGLRFGPAGNRFHQNLLLTSKAAVLYAHLLSSRCEGRLRFKRSCEKKKRIAAIIPVYGWTRVFPFLGSKICHCV